MKDPKDHTLTGVSQLPSDSSVSESDLSDDDLNDDDDDLGVDKQSDEEEEQQLKKTTASEKENLLLPADEYGQNLGQATLRGKKRKAAWKDEADSEVRVKDVTKNFR
jgi:hypothetical protein